MDATGTDIACFIRRIGTPSPSIGDHRHLSEAAEHRLEFRRVANTRPLARSQRCGNHVELMWRERIRALSDRATFSDAADEASFEWAEQALGTPLPSVLTHLLAESNGVWGEYDLGLVWPLERIVSDNLLFRSSPRFRDLYMPFDPLLFFADAGNGDQFAFVRAPQRDDIFVWDHETDSRTWVAGNLDQYLQWWLDGTLEI